VADRLSVNAVLLRNRGTDGELPCDKFKQLVDKGLAGLSLKEIDELKRAQVKDAHELQADDISWSRQKKAIWLGAVPALVIALLAAFFAAYANSVFKDGETPSPKNQQSPQQIASQEKASQDATIEIRD
jgi:hypothetical protein